MPLNLAQQEALDKVVNSHLEAIARKYYVKAKKLQALKAVLDEKISLPDEKEVLVASARDEKYALALPSAKMSASAAKDSKAIPIHPVAALREILRQPDLQKVLQNLTPNNVMTQDDMVKYLREKITKEINELEKKLKNPEDYFEQMEELILEYKGDAVAVFRAFTSPKIVLPKDNDGGISAESIRKKINEDFKLGQLNAIEHFKKLSAFYSYFPEEFHFLHKDLKKKIQLKAFNLAVDVVKPQVSL